jgi:hypothetical protein
VLTNPKEKEHMIKQADGHLQFNEQALFDLD